MRSDDELLSHIRQQTGIRRQRRQRAMVGSAAAAVVLLLAAGALAASVRGDDESVITDQGETTTSEPTTTTVATTTTEAGTTTTSTTTTTTTTAPPTGGGTPDTQVTPTTQPAIDPVGQTATAPGITLTVTATQHASFPGWVDLTIRVESAHGSSPSGYTSWAGEGPDVADGYGLFEDGVWLDCLPEEDPDTGDFLPAEPDPGAGPVDATFTESHHYDGDPEQVSIRVHAIVSYCYADAASTELTLDVPLGG